MTARRPRGAQAVPIADDVKPAEAHAVPVSDDARTTDTQEIAENSLVDIEAGEVTRSDRDAIAHSEFPIVGIGASAGGLAAFEAFFSGMPADTDPGMAFVLVQHLAPDHESILTDLIRRYTRMQVFEVEDGMIVHPNCTYIIPPNCDMAFINGTLQLLEPIAPRGQRLPIDFFFRSLAQDQHERAICIVLSGTGSDGTLGVRAIKGEGGMVMVQNPASTQYDGMPRSAIATGLVDYELTAAEMPAQLVAYATHSHSRFAVPAVALAPKAESMLKKIFVLLRAGTGHDFSQYKPSTINRRIQRRLAIHQIETLDRYVKYLQQTPGEVDALFRDLLIGVTSFFRDPEAFKALEEQVIPRLFNNKPISSTIRVWVPGCSTGEEAYSIAILLQERLDQLKKGYRLQIFATDIDSFAIATARTGVYPSNIAADITTERLERFFSSELDGSRYRIRKGIRDMLIFSEQDVVMDPPFSKLDLISCRNLLIYVGGDLQKKLIPLFHYALNPGGVLFLGTSETVGESSDLFTTLDRSYRLYQRKEGVYKSQHMDLARFLRPAIELEGAAPRAASKAPKPTRIALRDLTEQTLLQQIAPAGALVDSQGDIYYLHGRCGLYLEPAPGETGKSNILKMAREGLKRELTMALHQAVRTTGVVRRLGLRIKSNGDFTTTNLTIRPVTAYPAESPEAPLYLVILEEAPPTGSGDTLPATAANKPDVDAHIAALTQELRVKEEYLQTANEELETSNEELRSSNEEMQSVNEERQSVNEELATVNTELQTKVIDLSRANNDMNNLISGTGIGTVFVDLGQRILRFTPATTRIINLIATDVGRPMGHIVTNLVGYDRLSADVQSVIDNLIPKEVEVQTTDGNWYTLRILPYRTLENAIEGAVVTFVDITELKRIAGSLAQANSLSRLAVVVRDAHDAIMVQDLGGRIMAWNPGAVRIFGWSEAQALSMNINDMIPQGLREKALSRIQQLSLAEVLEPYRTQRIAQDGRVVEVCLTATALVNETGAMYAIATTVRENG
ncbi:MAG: chemotaxis protein CheB [Anaerolineae bacterium]